jgi:hypothetical protein
VIGDPRSGKTHIPDPGVKNAPDPGSATLIIIKNLDLDSEERQYRYPTRIL